jgi:hypothetical protein
LIDHGRFTLPYRCISGSTGHQLGGVVHGHAIWSGRAFALRCSQSLRGLPALLDLFLETLLALLGVFLYLFFGRMFSRNLVWKVVIEPWCMYANRLTETMLLKTGRYTVMQIAAVIPYRP